MGFETGDRVKVKGSSSGEWIIANIGPDKVVTLAKGLKRLTVNLNQLEESISPATQHTTSRF
ncbi:gp032 [Rhodococcus phage ReqiDocB7]|uniref:gp032 n=1 Tax=Rhodococcus phage ReqiDocB7 TaxID=691966 RepID=UPI0001CDD762|nr:gp032 [Rhodococcus phage ReqiDocB7]ADD80818.1 gp032 [Rhodococcus phage ReqiDocB7]